VGSATKYNMKQSFVAFISFEVMQGFVNSETTEKEPVSRFSCNVLESTFSIHTVCF